MSVKDVMAAEDLESIFTLPLSREAFDELQTLRDHLLLQAFDDQGKDTWYYQWGSTTYSAKKFYKMVFQSLPAHLVFS
jgi:hypothetical protein